MCKDSMNTFFDCFDIFTLVAIKRGVYDAEVRMRMFEIYISRMG